MSKKIAKTFLFYEIDKRITLHKQSIRRTERKLICLMWYIFAAGYKWVHYAFYQESVDNKQTYTIERQKSMQKNAIDYVDN